MNLVRESVRISYSQTLTDIPFFNIQNIYFCRLKDSALQSCWACVITVFMYCFLHLCIADPGFQGGGGGEVKDCEMFRVL
jgi:hypothetical protein